MIRGAQRYLIARSLTLGALLMVLVAALAAAGCADESEPAGAPLEMVAAWNLEAERAIFERAEHSPWESPLGFAMVHAAVYDAVNAIDRRYRPYVVALPARPTDSREAAAAAAARGVLMELFPEQRADLDAAYRDALARLPAGAATQAGAALGARAAQAVLDARAGDRRPDPLPPLAPATRALAAPPGRWVPTPPDRGEFTSRWLPGVRPFVVEDVDRLRTAGPLALTGNAYARELGEVRRLGARGVSTRTDDQTEIARFWSPDMMLSWSRALRGITATRGTPVADSARLFAMGSLAGADGAIACWADKARWSSWRPVTAIRAAGRDGNPATRPDPGWTPLVDTPPFPEHPSGHACISAATFGATARGLGTDRVGFDLYSPASATTRRFGRLSQAVDEVRVARLYAGAHFSSANAQGSEIGRAVVRALAARHLTPLTPACRRGFLDVTPSAPGERDSPMGPCSS